MPWRPCYQSGRRPKEGNATLFLSFPYVCPEPVLGKMMHFRKNGAKMAFLYEETAVSRPPCEVRAAAAAGERVRGLVID